MTTVSNETVIKTYLDVPSQPKLVLPSNSCDSHVHVFGPRERFPYADVQKINERATKSYSENIIW